MKGPVARRIALASTGTPPTEEALVDALVLLPDLLKGERLALGAEVAAPGGATFVVTGHTPAGAEAIGPQTIFELATVERKTRDVYDVLILVDASYSMRDHLRAAELAATDFFQHAEDVAATAALAIFRREPLLVREFAPAADQSARILRDTDPRGPADVAAALEWGLTTLGARGGADHRKALLVLTDSPGPRAKALATLAARAERLHVTIHVAVLGDTGDKAALQTLATRSGGTFNEGTKEPALRTALRALADSLGVPLDLPDAPGLPPTTLVEEEVEFEIIVTPIAPEEPRFPRRRRD